MVMVAASIFESSGLSQALVAQVIKGLIFALVVVGWAIATVGILWGLVNMLKSRKGAQLSHMKEKASNNSHMDSSYK